MTSSTASLVDVRGLQVSVQSEDGVHLAVKHLSLAVARGQTFALVGESGCGKSMTAMALMRLLPEVARIEAGEVILGHEDLPRLSEQAMQNVRGAKISMIFQEPATSLNPVMSIGQQVAEVIARHEGGRRVAHKQKAISWLDRVGIVNASERYDDFPFQFSGGQKQRIMIALALAAEPQLLVADEPTTALDVTVQAQVLQLLADIQQEMGLGILLITHDLAVVRQHANYVALMRSGEIVESGPAESFFSAPTHPYAKELLAAIPTFARRGYSLTNGQCLPAKNLEHAKKVLNISNLQVSYKQRGGLFKKTSSVAIVKDFSLHLYAGETLALLGSSGCGKSTVARSLLRLLDKQAVVAGQVDFLGQNVLKARGKDLHAIRSGLQIVFQDPYASLDPRMMVGEILDEGMAALRTDFSRSERQARAKRLIEQVGLPNNTITRYPHEFSGGQRQRIAIARALAVEPKVLICDEPTSALDVSVQAQILDLLQQLQADLGLAYLLITHNFGVVEYMADRVAIMDAGSIIEQGAAENILFHPQAEQTRRLLAAVPRIN